jgi:microcystin-dependent protein
MTMPRLPPQGTLDLITILQATYPVGAIYTSVVSTSPATLFGFGTWADFGAGRMLVGIDAGDADYDVVEETGGAKVITLATTDIPAHNHTQDAHNHTQDTHNHTQDAHHHHFTIYVNATGGGGNTRADTVAVTPDAPPTSDTTATNQTKVATNQAATATNQNTGGGGSHKNVPPYIVVYRWKRTA